MILPDFKAFPRVGRIIGIDWGARRVGVAISDEARGFVFTRPVVDGGNDLAHRVAQMAMAEKCVGIVVGLPLHADGTDSDTTMCVREFAKSVSDETNLPICFVDETLTSVCAQESMGRVRRTDIKQRLDSESARVILENAISIMSRIPD